MDENLHFVQRDENLILAAALAFTLELFEPKKEEHQIVEQKPPSISLAEPAQDYSDEYQPQCDRLQTDDYSEPINTRPEVSFYCDDFVEEITASDMAALEPYEMTALSKPSKPKNDPITRKTMKRTTTDFIPEPKRYSSRQVFLRLAREEAEKNRTSIPTVNKRKTTYKKKKPNPNSKSTNRETPKERKKREQEARTELAKHRKERQIIEKATTATVRAFGYVASLKSKTGKKNLSSWQNWHVITVQFLRELNDNPRNTYRKSQFHIYLVNSITVMEKTMASARPRPPEIHNLMMQFVVDFTKVWDIANQLGVKQVIGEMGRLLENVLGFHLASPTRMNPTNLPWIQTKTILELMLSIVIRVEVAYDVLILLNRIHHCFLTKWAHQTNKHMEYKSFAITQLHSLLDVLSRRLSQLCEQQKYNI
ncbi:hypothetical protein CRE_10836 [Caenorhabditis remanei]|uniref:Uncharacterized protein n=1 Tax=Caenorhabditis remanei TaxID=31234 RepID=E3M540_CAERE|nr:hypothetical protein CRE_10836 [Caenorhabditis remanei]